jgi:hypothetical protein
MVSTFLLMAMIFAVGTRAADSMRVRQEEVILRKLSVPQAAVFYDELTRRARRVRFLRAITFAALVLTILAARRRFLAPKLMRASDAAADVTPAGPPTNTEAAKAIARRALERQVARGVGDASGLQLREVTGDDRHPWIFEYIGPAADDGGRATVRVYVDRAGRTEVHRIHD